MFEAAARSSPCAEGSLETTRTISAGNEAFFAASISATMLEPRPEIRTATRFRAMGLEPQRAVISDARLVLRRARHFTDRRHLLTFTPKHLHDGVCLARLDHRDHADAAVEGSQHLVLGDIAHLGEPLEH